MCEPSHVVLNLIVTNHVTTIEAGNSCREAREFEAVLTSRSVASFTTVVRVAIEVLETGDADEVALTEWGTGNDVVVTED
jgi:hypothetical protein